jgi:hypothetical protein
MLTRHHNRHGDSSPPALDNVAKLFSLTRHTRQNNPDAVMSEHLVPAGRAVLSAESNPAEDNIDIWQYMVMGYSKLSLSRRGDRLLAVSGLAKQNPSVPVQGHVSRRTVEGRPGQRIGLDNPRQLGAPAENMDGPDLVLGLY